MRAPILCYHKVGEPHDRSLNVTVRDFRRQVAFLARRYRLIPLREFHNAEGRCVVLTFDDAYACSTEPLLQVARDYDASGTVFPVTAFVGDKSRWDGENARELAGWQALARLRDAGYEIGNHTHTHTDLSARPVIPSPCSEAEGLSSRSGTGGSGRWSSCALGQTERATSEGAAHESTMLSLSKHDPAGGPSPAETRERATDEDMLRQAQHDVSSPSLRTPHPSSPPTLSHPSPLALESEMGRPAVTGGPDAGQEIAIAEREIDARLGIRPLTFAYPFGRYDDAAVRAVRARGYVAAVTVRYGIASDRHDPHLFPRIMISYSDGLPGLLYKLYIRPLLQGTR